MGVGAVRDGARSSLVVMRQDYGAGNCSGNGANAENYVEEMHGGAVVPEDYFEARD